MFLSLPTKKRPSKRWGWSVKALIYFIEKWFYRFCSLCQKGADTVAQFKIANKS
jgi:hypothetical protein